MLFAYLVVALDVVDNLEEVEAESFVVDLP